MLELDDRQKLVQTIANLYEFTDSGPRGRRVLLEQAGLQSFVSGIDLSGPADVVAQDIIGRLERKGYLIPDRVNYHALGALLTYVLTLTDLSSAQEHFIAQMIIRYALILFLFKLTALYQKTASRSVKRAKLHEKASQLSILGPEEALSASDE